MGAKQTIGVTTFCGRCPAKTTVAVAPQQIRMDDPKQLRKPRQRSARVPRIGTARILLRAADNDVKCVISQWPLSPQGFSWRSGYSKINLLWVRQDLWHCLRVYDAKIDVGLGGEEAK
jgi:hypothetical protein